MVVEFLQGVKNPILHIDRYLYYKNCEKKEKVFWRCTRYPECKARAVTRSQLTHERKDEGQIAEYLKAVGYNIQM